MFSLSGRSLVASFTLAAALPLLLPVPGAAYPISPMTLWELTEEADVVVLAEVDWIHRPPEVLRIAAMELGRLLERDVELDTTAILRVREVWKGSAGAFADVAFEPNMICPAPARYVPDRTVVAFLRAQEDRMPFQGTFRTVGLSYGTIYPPADAVDAYRSLVREARALQERGEVSEAEHREWLVRAAERRATRWQGVYGLVPKGDEVHSYYDRSGREGAAGGLTEAQLDRIAAGFVAEPSVDRTLLMVLRILAGRPDPAVDEAAVAAIEAWVYDERVPFWLPEAMAMVLLRYGDRDPAARLEGLGEGEWSWEIDAVALRESWQRAKEAVGVPTVAPAPRPEVPVPGTAENTPS